MIQPSALNFVIVALMVIIFGTLWRALAARMAEHPVGQAMAVTF